MDVLRTGVSALGCALPEADSARRDRRARHRDRLIASLGSMLCYWYHFAHSGRRIEVQTDDDSIGGHFLHLLHGSATAPSLGARHAHLAQSVRRA